VGRAHFGDAYLTCADVDEQAMRMMFAAVEVAAKVL